MKVTIEVKVKGIDPNGVYTVQQVADLLGRTVARVHQLRRQGYLSNEACGAEPFIMFTGEEVIAYVERTAKSAVYGPQIVRAAELRAAEARAAGITLESN